MALIVICHNIWVNYKPNFAIFVHYHHGHRRKELHNWICTWSNRHTWKCFIFMLFQMFHMFLSLDNLTHRVVFLFNFHTFVAARYFVILAVTDSIVKKEEMRCPLKCVFFFVECRKKTSNYRSHQQDMWMLLHSTSPAKIANGIWVTSLSLLDRCAGISVIYGSLRRILKFLTFRTGNLRHKKNDFMCTGSQRMSCDKNKSSVFLLT